MGFLSSVLSDNSRTIAAERLEPVPCFQCALVAAQIRAPVTVKYCSKARE